MSEFSVVRIPDSLREQASPASVQPAPDRRVLRTRQALRQALVSQVRERGFDVISVGDLCAAANITRGTFYNHFGDKEQMLRAFEDEVLAGLDVFQERMAALSLKDLARTVARKKPLPLLVQMFDYLRSEGDFLDAMLHGDSGFTLRLRDAICTNLVHSVLHERYRNSDDAFVNYYVAFFASAYLGVIMRWLETGMQEDSHQMALIAQRLLFISPGEPIRL